MFAAEFLLHGCKEWKQMDCETDLIYHNTKQQLAFFLLFSHPASAYESSIAHDHIISPSRSTTSFNPPIPLLYESRVLWMWNQFQRLYNTSPALNNLTSSHVQSLKIYQIGKYYRPIVFENCDAEVGRPAKGGSNVNMVKEQLDVFGLRLQSNISDWNFDAQSSYLEVASDH
ncbi:hypothetical protein OSB04_013087 [Centaurea solstitialis]|uniref:Uncharacterized protein n=1 Tax=Centaurea solstitialis TaxID=347529 RepID=A0AA38TXB5_9ASTR|nr:hypothetical protein OSB04_013087 [Centaurea solstitialis]